MIRLACLILWVLLSPVLRAHDGDHPPPRPVPEVEQHRPTALPDRVVLTWTGDPATTQAVTWRTDTSVSRAVAELAVAAGGPQPSGIQVMAATTPLQTDLGSAHYHTAEFRHLEPDTLYAYRVGDTVNWSEWHHFRTARAESAPFTFLYFGDAQNSVRTHWSRVVREAFKEAPRAAFTLHAGDLINRAVRDAEWGEWFGAPAWVNATLPVIPTPGNHEYFAVETVPTDLRLWDIGGLATIVVTLTREEEKDAQGAVASVRVGAVTADGRCGVAWLDGEGRVAAVDEGWVALTGYAPGELLGRTLGGGPLKDRQAIPARRSVTPHWRPQFALPTHGPAGLEETVYWLDYQGTRIVSLNSNERQEEQVDWLRDVLSRNPQRWTILTFHHPIFSPARNRDNPRLRELWKPVFDEFRVDLVLTGHDHTYARSGDVGGRVTVGVTNVAAGYQQAYDPEVGTVYVVSVSGPKMYAQSQTDWAVRRAEDTQLFQVITVDGDELRYEARTATSELYDAFTLRKRPGAANRLVEVLPPENRRGGSGSRDGR